MDMNPITEQLTGDERLFLLAMALDTRVGLTFDEIAQRGFLGNPQNMKPESLRHTFALYRRQLGEIGIRIIETELGGTARYKIDAHLTYADPQDISLSEDEALTLVTMLSLYLAGSDAPYTEDVRRARNKLVSVMGLPSLETSEASDKTRKSLTDEKKLYDVLSESYRQRHCVTFTYQNTRGICEIKTVAIFGMFERLNRTYLVARDDTTSHHPDNTIKVYRLDRIASSSVKADPKARYQIPADFNVLNYTHLPFQYGSQPSFIARFRRLPSASDETLTRLTHGKGTWEHDETSGETTWSIEACNLESLARWAVGAMAVGLIPLEPPELIDAVRAGLERVERIHV